jgi:histidinol-phosphate aminotransferase
MRSIWDLANSHLRALSVYEPGKPIEETARELGVDPGTIIKLASNENPLGPSPKALAAIRAALDQAHLYPDGGGFYLREALAARLQVASENIVLGNGSNEIIEFLAHAFVRPGDDVVMSAYAFVAYKLIAALFDARPIEAASPDYHHDVEAMLKAITPRTRLVIIANPNNPTGTLISQQQIDDFVSHLPENVVAVFDEAYFEFLDHAPDTMRYVREGKNIVVLRTFSKIHGLAGLRIGYGIARRDLVEVLQKTRQPFNVNSIGLAGALAALSDDAHQRKTKETVDAGRAYLEKEFASMGLKFVPSVANFVMVDVGDGPSVFKELLASKVIVRPLRGYNLKRWVRISVGTMEQNQRCIEALEEVLAKHHRA